ncbi:MAG: nickel-dependent hydrogenase large subunit [Rhodospirillaceae bacterium]|nr:nickel-dependent hydrogenase large subunit [Rhodospirillales bacterium]
MFPEARLDVALTVQSGVVAQVKVHSTRLVQASRLFAGRRPDEVTQLLPTIFALCGTAQVLAGLGAMEQAAGLGTPQRHARQILLLAETIGEHGLGLARDWPALVGAAPDLPAARRIKTAMVSVRAALYPNGDWHRPSGGTLTPQHDRITAAIAEVRAALTELLGAEVESILTDATSFHAWIATARTPAARLLAQLQDPALAGFGRGPFLPMPDQGPADLPAQMQADHDGAYVARPHSGGRIYETGPLARTAWHPVVAELMAEHGPGLLARLTARLVEVVSCLQEMTELMQDLTAAHSLAPVLGDGMGVGLVEAARGLLAHRVELEGGKVKRYQILAPTEWNFHPEGPLVRGLKGAPDHDLHHRAALLIHALDPCVACHVTVDHA